MENSNFFRNFPLGSVDLIHNSIKVKPTFFEFSLGLSIGRFHVEHPCGQFLARGMPDAVQEAGENNRTVLVQFESLDEARAAYASSTAQIAPAARSRNTDQRRGAQLHGADGGDTRKGGAGRSG